ncbi:MAG TPA: transcriptional regulator [Candidatus Elarobacter sp.]|jgi:DNA-binding winged helix-turn-helix (wHTH) protein|nr:transcriptional regulator [Candidatus Elarobacter sp.]
MSSRSGEGGHATKIYRFDDFTLDPARRVLLRAMRPVEITAKSFDLLCALVANAGIALSKHWLLDNVWGTVEASESTLTQHVYMLRRALGEDTRQALYIVTVPGKGYRFIGSVETHDRTAWD